MSDGPQFRIRDELYPIPQNERLGELRLIERVTGITHREFRQRAIDQQERLAELGDLDGADADDLTPRQVLAVLDDIVTVGRIAQAIQRAHSGWSTERVAVFVDELDEGDVIMEGGADDEADASPPANGEPDRPSSSPSGTDSAPQSSSDSATASSESTTPPSSGPSTSPTSPEARSDLVA